MAKKLRRRRDKCACRGEDEDEDEDAGCVDTMGGSSSSSSLSLVSVFSVLWFVLILDDDAFCALIKDAFAPRLVWFLFFGSITSLNYWVMVCWTNCKLRATGSTACVTRTER